MKTDIVGNSREIMIDTRAFLLIHKKSLSWIPELTKIRILSEIIYRFTLCAFSFVDFDDKFEKWPIISKKLRQIFENNLWNTISDYDQDF